MTLRLVTICTHNRTRSVLMGALLADHFGELDVVTDITTAGTMADGRPVTATTVQLLAERGIDASAHVSGAITAEMVKRAHLVITAEIGHVVHVAASWPAAFDRTFTLPELVQRGEAAGPRDGRPIAVWLTDVGHNRPRGYDYLAGHAIPEVDDPTGRSAAVWHQSFTEIDHLCARLARLVA